MSDLIEILCPSQQLLDSHKPLKQPITYHNLHQYLKKLTGLSDSIKHFQYSNEKYRILLQLNLQNHLPTVIQKIEIDIKKCEYKSKFTFKSGGLLLNCQTKCLRIMIIRELQMLRKRMKFYSFVFNVGHQSGEMVAKCVFAIVPHANLYEILINELVPLKSHFNRFLSIVMFRTNQLPPLFLELIHQRTKRAQQVNIQDRIEKRIYKYYTYSIIELCKSLSQSPSVQIEDPVDKQLVKKLENERFVGFEEINSELYFHRPKSKFEIQNKFNTCEQESDNIRTHLAFPKMRSETNIFNEIKVIIQRQSNEVINTGFRGGNNRIMIIKLKFMYMNSLINPGITHNNKPLATKQYSKFLAIKVPIEPLRQGNKKSSQHEIKILKLFNDVQSPFLLRYFVDRSQSFKYGNMLMMSFMNNCDTLSTFLSKRNQVLSFNSKLYILINLLQALRFIKQYNVVHMDVSPGNILVNPNHMVQLIDFGQSYHPSVCDANYRPGYTLPFSFPEKFRQRQFTSKSDIFSFAIVVFFCIFKGYPYHPSPRLAHSLKNLTYRNKFYFAPESGEYFGYRKIIAFLFSYIQKCMDKDLVIRPHPSQSIILFKQMYYWLYEMSMTI